MRSRRRRYCVKGWKNTKLYFLTDKEIYEKVKKDSESDYNWFTSASELVKVCSQPGFSQLYAREIKIAILNCFSNIERWHETDKENKEAVCFCYHSLDTSERAREAKRRYLEAKVQASIKYFRYSVLAMGKTMEKLLREWEKTKVDEYILKEEIDFKQVQEECYAEFKELYAKIEKKEGSNNEEKEEFVREMKKYMFSMLEYRKKEDYYL